MIKVKYTQIKTLWETLSEWGEGEFWGFRQIDKLHCWHPGSCGCGCHQFKVAIYLRKLNDSIIMGNMGPGMLGTESGHWVVNLGLLYPTCEKSVCHNRHLSLFPYLSHGNHVLSLAQRQCSCTIHLNHHLSSVTSWLCHHAQVVSLFEHSWFILKGVTGFQRHEI